MLHRRIVACVALVLIVPSTVLALSSSAGAVVTLTVTNSHDSGAGSLRQAFANLSSGGSFATSNGTINIPASVGNIVLATGELQYDGGTGGNHSLTIVGNGNTISQHTTLSGGIDTNTTATISLYGITLAAAAASPGDGIFAENGVVLNRTIVTGWDIGLVSNASVVSLTESEVLNSARSGLETTGNTTLVRSTVAGNARFGIDTNGAGNLTAINSTVTGNATQAAFSGITANAVTLTYATVVGNGTGSPGDANVETTGDLTTFGSVVALQNHQHSCHIGGAVHSHGFNFSDDTSCGFTAASDKQGSGHTPALGALAANGGPTQTRVPAKGSALIDAIPTASCAAGTSTDQRGVVRPQGVGCDIGAVELQSTSEGFRTTSSDGGVYNFGSDLTHGSLPASGITPPQPIVGIATTPSGNGYWLAGADGSVYHFGGAGSFGSLPALHVTPPQPIVGIAATPTGNGYWLVGSDGAVYGFGGASYFGSLPSLHITPTKAIVAIASTPSGNGYWLAGADGGMFAFGGAGYFGSLPSQHITPAQPVVSLAATPSGNGYWLAGADGGTFAIGGAGFQGSWPGAGGAPAPVTGLEPTPNGAGYWLTATDGTTKNFGNATNLGNTTPTAPVTGISK